VEFGPDLLKKTQWFLDFDGSLCPHIEVWQERNYDPQRIFNLLSRLSKKCSGIYWNTGRRPESLAGVLPDFMKFPGYFIHGSVRWDDRSQKSELLAPVIPSSVVEFFENALKAHRELRLEIKPTGLRIAPFDPQQLPKLELFMETTDFQTPEGWTWMKGARGAELLATGFDKGLALRRECRAGLIPVVIGDDRFDGPAFEEALRRGGFAFLVGEHCGFSTEIEQQAWQTIYHDDSTKVLARIEKLLADL
jgi:trehalose-6-phosphatase